MVEREGVTHGPPVTFPSRLLSLLREGEESVGRRREGVGGVGESERAIARTDLLEALQSADSHLLSPEVTQKMCMYIYNCSAVCLECLHLSCFDLLLSYSYEVFSGTPQSGHPETIVFGSPNTLYII